MKMLLRLYLLQIVISFSAIVNLHAQNVVIPELDLSFNSEQIQLSEEAERYIQSVVAIIKNEAIHRQKLNIDHIGQAMRYYANGAQRLEDTHTAIQKVMPLLQDHHSYFMTSAYVSKSLGLGSDDIEVIKNGQAPHIDKTKIDSLKVSLEYASGKLMAGNVGYLSVPPFNNLYHEAMTMFADSLQRIIQSLDRQNLTGWIIDLRDNSGGADMPMIAGLGPLLDSNNVYYSIDESGNVQARSFYKDGGYYNIESGEKTESPLVQSTIKYKLANANLTIAILTNRKTASSAEAVTTIFAEQPNVKIVGSKTAGLTTVNSFNFLEDNSVLNLTIGYYANRNRKVYKQGIAPDLEIKAGTKPDEAMKEDIVVQSALEWIKK